MKLLFSVSIIISSVRESKIFSKGPEESVQYRHLHLATIFAFFGVAAIVDILKGCSKTILIPDMEYVILILSFGIQGVLRGFHILDKTAQEWAVYNLLMISSFVCCSAVALEMKVRDQLYCPLFRAVSVIVLGSWQMHAVFLAEDRSHGQYVDTHSRVIILSIYFTWHCAINFITAACLWLMVVKCLKQGYCPCTPALMHESEPDGIYLENRIRFDYHYLDRLESDLD